MCLWAAFAANSQNNGEWFERVKQIEPNTQPANYEKYKDVIIREIQDDFEYEWKSEFELHKFITHMFLYEVNLQREKLWLGKLSLDPLLTEGARGHADFLAKNNYSGHVWPKGNYWNRTYEKTKNSSEEYIHTGENNALGSQNVGVKDIVELSMQSKGHRPTLTKRKWVSPNYLWVGIGVSEENQLSRIVVWTAKK